MLLIKLSSFLSVSLKFELTFPKEETSIYVFQMKKIVSFVDKTMSCIFKCVIKPYRRKKDLNKQIKNSDFFLLQFSSYSETISSKIDCFKRPI